MKILLTGSNGQLGSALKNILSGTILATTRKSLDITSRRACQNIMDFEKPDMVVNCAAFTNINAAEYRKVTECKRVNTEGVRNLSRASTCSFVQISTDQIFEGTSSPYSERSTPRPQNVYGRSKYEAEQVLLNTAPHRHYIIRTSGLYGIGHNNFVTQVLERVANGNSLQAATDIFSHLTYVKDLADALAWFVDACPRTGVYNIATRGIATMYELAQTICAYGGYDPELILPCLHSDLQGARRPPKVELSMGKYNDLYDAPQSHLTSWREGLSRFFTDIGKPVSPARYSFRSRRPRSPVIPPVVPNFQSIEQGLTLNAQSLERLRRWENTPIHLEPRSDNEMTRMFANYYGSNWRPDVS